MIAATDDTAYIKIVGGGTFRHALDFRNIVSLSLPDKPRGVLVDLSDATTLDSTFIGTVTNLAMTQQGKIKLYNVPDNIADIIDKLGLTDLIPVVSCTPPESLSFSCIAERPHSSADSEHAMLEAHKTLSSLNDDNRNRFKHVLSVLNDDDNTPSS